MTKKKKKYSNKQKLIYLISTLVIMSVFFFLDFYFKEKKKEKIENGSFETFAVIEKFKLNVSKNGSYRRRKDVVYFYFLRNDTVFHKIENKSKNYVENNNISLGDSFRIKVANSDYNSFEIDYSKKVDSTIDKSIYYNFYEKEHHKNFIE